MDRPIEKERHGCFTAWLILLALFYLLGAGSSVFRSAAANAAMANFPAWVTPVGTVTALLKLACVAALFSWKRVGFWGLAVLAVIQAGIAQMMSGQIAASAAAAAGPAAGLVRFLSTIGVVLPFVFLAILYGVMQIGGPKKAWPQLE